MKDKWCQTKTLAIGICQNIVLNILLSKKIVTIIRQFLKFIRLEWWFVTWYPDLPILLSIAELGKFCKNYYFYDWFTIAVSKKGTFCLDIVVKKVGLTLLVTM